jgi:hypothetical protein
MYAQKSMFIFSTKKNKFLGEKLSLTMEIVEFKKNLVFKELHNYYVTNFGFDHGVVKYSNLLGLMNELNVKVFSHIFKNIFSGT